MKRIFAVVLALSCLLGLSACGKTPQVEIDYGTSQLYSHADMDDAIHEIKKAFTFLGGCELYALSYTSDEKCESELDYCNEFPAEDIVYTECIVFDSRFRSPVEGGGAWEPNRIYTWSWYLARSNNGNWDLLTYGYG